MPDPVSRRRFLHQLALGGTGLAVASCGLLDAADTPHRFTVRTRPIRIRGRVQAGAQGLAGVAVTDGLEVVTTDGTGAFELIAAPTQPFVYLSLPDGYRIPQNRIGTARFYEPIVPDDRDEMQVRFRLEADPHSAERHAFLVLADPQTQNAFEMGLLHDEVVPDVHQTVKRLGDQSVFGVTCGDLVFDNLSLFSDYERAAWRMGLPFFQVVGNHDLNTDGPGHLAATNTFRRHFGPTYYSFDRGAAHYVVLNDVFWHGSGYIGYLDDGQLRWLKQDLARVEAGRLVVVFVHIPVLSARYHRAGAHAPSPTLSITNRDVLYHLLQPYDAHIISGHTHECEHVFEGGTHEHVLGTVCGAWWSGPICHDGTPSGYAVFEVHGEELRWHYKATGHPETYQLRLAARGPSPEAPDELVANVWDWYPGWEVVWIEDGEPRGPMTRRTGTDPLSEELHRGADRPPRQPWVDPMRTDHLFVAPIRPQTRTIRVDATNPWGRTYTATYHVQ